MWRWLARLLIPISISFLLSVTSNSYAIEFISFNVEQTDYSGWQIEDLQFESSIQQPAQAVITVSRLLSPSGEVLENLSFHCPFSEIRSFDNLKCSDGRFSFQHKKLGKIEGQLAFSYAAGSGATDFKLSKVRLAGGIFHLTVGLENKKWTANLVTPSVGFKRLKKLVTQFVDWPQGFSDESGQLGFALALTGHDATIESIELRIETVDLGFDGQSVAEELDAELELSATKNASNWQITETVKLNAGVIYIDPGIKIGKITPGLLLEIDDRPIEQNLQGRWIISSTEEQFSIKRLSFSHPKVLNLSGSGQIKIKPEFTAKNLQVSMQAEDLQDVFPVYLQPFLYGSGLDKMELSGKTDLAIKLEKDRISDFHLVMEDVYIDDQNERFHVAGLDGDLRLNSDPEPAPSSMSWRAGSIYKISLGHGKMKLESRGRSMYLREKMVVPIFDGEFQVDTMRMDNLGQEDYSIHMDSRLTPIRLSEFTETMSWPLMAGNISGEIPGLSYYKGDLSVDGVLNTRVFDGDIAIRQLKIEGLFDTVPVLYSDIKVTDLDLGVLTKTFEFGNISGKLSGYVKDLKLEDWQPVGFDASFFTPDNDKSRHRISQRAIDNITTIGGGGGANAISKGVLGIFDEFPYSRLKLSCRLENGTCYMHGMKSSGDGYYIVKPGLLPPWLEVKGYNSEVNWQDLLNRLENISKTDGPVVK